MKINNEIGIKKVDDLGTKIEIKEIGIKKVDDLGIKILSCFEELGFRKIKSLGKKSWWFRNKKFRKIDSLGVKILSWFEKLIVQGRKVYESFVEELVIRNKNFELVWGKRFLINW